ncbi:MAG: putative Ig domain-containing protein [Planctomycetes bacterium]|nr:putative Ig domain-containing protein [Planctomycetota bacterium]
MTPPLGIVGNGYTLEIMGINGVPAYEWRPLGGTNVGDTWTGGGLPPGLTLSGNSGVISGVPTTPGLFSVLVELTDQNGSTLSRQIQIEIISPPTAVTVLTTSLPRGDKGQPYVTTLLSTGGSGPYTWSVSAGALPSWETLDPATGVITGTPDALGTTTIQVTARDRNGNLDQSIPLDLLVVGILDLGPPSLPPGTPGTPYSETLTPSGGVGPYTLRIVSGSLPPGITFDPLGPTFGGTTSQTGSFPVLVEVCDSAGSCAIRAYELVFDPTDPVISAIPGNGTVGDPFTATITASGGQAPYVFTVAAGTLPPRLSLAQDGTISGTPTLAGNFVVTFQVTDGNGKTSTATVIIEIQLAAGPPPAAGLGGGRVQGSGSCALGSSSRSEATLPFFALLLVLLLLRFRPE